MPIDSAPLNLDSLPAVIAGPIMRRVTRTRASVWFATRIAGPVTIDVRRSGVAGPPQTATTTPQQCGAHVFVGVVSIDGFEGVQNDEFLAGVSYEYELSSMAWPAGSAPTWSELAYGVATRPAFVGVPDQLGDLDMAHASCRMPHGAFRDGLGALDAQALSNATTRPRLLVMSGDQIYADAVAGPLMPRLQRLATDLVGVAETDVFPALPRIDGRQELTTGPEASNGFDLSSEEAENHLWTYNEFVAMYLLVWSDLLWPTSVPRWADVNPAIDIDPDANLDEETWNDYADRLEQFKIGLPGVRRLLANTPTLMVFDDHEVTDDWNLNHDWCTRVYANTAGSRVVVNALITYTLFQHWGNVPDRFTAGGTAEANFLAGAWTAAQVPDWAGLKPLVGVPQAVANTAGDLRVLDATTIRFDVSVETTDGWPAKIVLLDERTARRLDPALGVAGRISTTAIDQMLPSPAAGAASTPLIAIAPSPLFGLNLLENQIQPLLALLPDGDKSFDYEPWVAFAESFEHLLARFAEFGQVVMLSGDVHFGSTGEIRYRSPAAGSSEFMAQLTSSGAKRAESKTVMLHVFGELMRKLGLVRTRTYQGYAQLTSGQRALFVSPPPDHPSLQYDDIADILLGRVFREAQKSPAVFSADVANAYGLPPGDWEYDVNPIDDNAMPTPVAEPTLSADITAAANVAPSLGWNPTNSYAIVRGLRAADLWRIGLVLVGLPQVSRIRFDTTDPLTVHHQIVAAVGESQPRGDVVSINTAVQLS